MRFIVLGGGCYGTFYTQQLIRAAEAGAIPQPEIVVVDHNERPRAMSEIGPDARVCFARADWADFFDTHLTRLPDDADDQIVPPPFTPHLALSWLLNTLRSRRSHITWEIEPFSVMPATPYVRQAENGTLTASHADWICPVHCVEPSICPKTRGPRHWDMAITARELADQLTEHGQPVNQVHLLQCLHFTYGVGTYAASMLLKARNELMEARPDPGRPIRAIVGTVSRCHGAMHLLKGHLGTDTVSPQDIYSRVTMD